MKKSMGSFVAVNRKALLILGVVVSVAVFGIASWRASAWSNAAGTAASVSQAKPAVADTGDAEWARVLEEHVKNGTFEMLSSAKQLQLQLKSGMKVEDGVLKPGIPNDVRPYRQLFDTKRIEILAESQSILAALANPLVNDQASDGASGQVTQSESTILNINGTALVASFNDSGSFIGGVNSFTGYSTTTDSGATWTDRGIVPLLSQQNFGDPVLARRASNGAVFLSTLSGGANGMNCYKSTDNGVTFSTVANCAPDSSGSANTDKEWLAVDNFAGPGNGNIYHVYRDFGGTTGIYLNRSTDDGVTYPAPRFQIIAAAAGNVQGPWVMVGADHAVYVPFYDSQTTPDRIAIRKSTDQGVTFGAVVGISNLVTTGTNGSLNVPAGYRSSAFPSCATNPANANMLACVHGDVTVAGGPDSNIFYNQSTDGGATWSANLRLNTDAGTNAQTHPAMTWMPDGSALAVSWQDSRADAANRRVQRFGVIGTVSGTTVTFSPNFQISQPNWTPSFGADPVVNTVYMGDYDTMDADNSFFYSTFTDCRNAPVEGQDVRFARIPKAGPGAILGPASSTPLTLSPANNTCTDFFATIANNGTAAANSVTATFTTATAGVTLTQNVAVPYGTIAAGGSATNTTPVKISVASNFVCGTTIVIDVTTSTGESFSYSITTQGLGYQTTTLTNQTLNGGTVNVGNSGDDVVTSGIVLPFPFPFNGANQTTINVSSNGNAQFTSANTAFTNVCPLPSAAFTNALYAHWDDMRTDRAGGGIFTSTTGVAPNRVFNIEWRAVTFSTPETEINYEIRLYETSGVIEYVYDEVTGNATNTNGSSASVGVQKGTGAGPNDVTSFSCNTASLSDGFLVRFTPTASCPQGNGTCVAGATADLAITKTDGVTTVTPGQAITYTIVASNNGPSAVVGATVTDTFPTPALTGISWTCVASAGSSCPAGPTAGNINALVNLLPGGTATFTANATVSPTATFGFSNVATIAVPAIPGPDEEGVGPGVIDPNPANNSARDTDTVCPPAGQQTFTGTGTGAIPDGLTGTPPQFGAPLTVSFPVAGMTGPLTNVVANVTLNHTWVGDVDMVLNAPGGAPSLVLASRIGVTTAGSFGDSSNYGGLYTFADSAAGTNIWTVATNAGCGDACVVTVGSYRTTGPGQTGQTNPPPVTSLNTTFGALTTGQINGTWTLVVRDAASADIGTVTAATLQLTGAGGGGCNPTAAGVTISGRILTPEGYGLRNAIVTITDSLGVSRTARTSAFGYYTFDNVEVGTNYVISVGSKRYTFTPRLLTVNDAVSDFDFIGVSNE